MVNNDGKMSEITLAKILVIDQDGDFYPFANQTLAPLGYELDLVDSLDSAMDEIDQQWPDLIIEDIDFHDRKKHLDFGERIHHDPILRFLPIIHIINEEIADTQKITGEEEPHYLAACLKKPFSPDALSHIISEVLEKRK
jgi:DNA-binding NtrC family response regulator